MNNKDLNKHIDKLGGSLSNSNTIKISNLDSMLESESTNSDTSAYTSSILDLFYSSDSDSSYDSEGGKGKSKGKKSSKKSKKNKNKKNKKNKRRNSNSDSDSDSLLDHISSSDGRSNTMSKLNVQQTQPQPGLANLANLSSLGSVGSFLQQPTMNSMINGQIPYANSAQNLIQQIPNMMTPVQGIASALPQMINSQMPNMMTTAQGIASALPQMTNPQMPNIMTSAQGIASALPQMTNPQMLSMLSPLAGLLGPQPPSQPQFQPQQNPYTVPQTIQITPQQMQILAPLLAQLIANPYLKLSGGKIDVDLKEVDNEIELLQKKLNL